MHDAYTEDDPYADVTHPLDVNRVIGEFFGGNVWSYTTNLTRNFTIETMYAPTYPYVANKSIDDQFNMMAFNNSSLIDTCEKDKIDDSTYFQTTVYMLYILIFVLALFGNGVVCYIVVSTPRMKTVTNYFIVNLAVGGKLWWPIAHIYSQNTNNAMSFDSTDILMSLFCVPFSFFSILLLQYWPFGSVMCHLVNYSQAVSVLVSAYTLVAISIDRYIAILWPLRPRISKR